MGRCGERKRKRELHLLVFLLLRSRLLFSSSLSLSLSVPPGGHRLVLTTRTKQNSPKKLKTSQQFELTDLSSPPLADDAAAARVLSRASEAASDAPVALWIVSSGAQALGGVAKVRN